MSKLFETSTINGMTIKNRFVRSATFEAMATMDGACTDKLTELNAELAKGQVGLIITGYAYVNDIGKSRAAQSGIHSDALIQGWAEHVESVHKHGGAIVMQIAHAGCNSFVIPEGGNALGPSSLKMPQGCQCRDMTTAEISETVDKFADSAVRANRFNMEIQDNQSKDQNRRGALKGSHPINGGYMTYRYPNWASKFFIDALLKERKLQLKRQNSI